MTRKKPNPRPTSAKTVRRTRYVTKQNTAKFKYKVKGSRGAVYKTTTLKEARKMAGKSGTISKIGGSKKRNPKRLWVKIGPGKYKGAEGTDAQGWRIYRAPSSAVYEWDIWVWEPKKDREVYTAADTLAAAKRWVKNEGGWLRRMNPRNPSHRPLPYGQWAWQMALESKYWYGAEQWLLLEGGGPEYDTATRGDVYKPQDASQWTVTAFTYPAERQVLGHTDTLAQGKKLLEDFWRKGVKMGSIPSLRLTGRVIKRTRRYDNPVRKVRGGWQWGDTGKVYKRKADADKQAQAIYASGWREPNP